MPKATSKRLYTAVHLGISRTIEEFTPPKKKRLESAKPAIFGDGQSKVTYNHDPAFGCEEVTIRMITTEDDPYIQKAEAARARHKNDPSTAEPMILRTHKADGSVIATKTLFRAVIQSIQLAEGSTSGHDNAMYEVVVQPEDFE